MAQRNSEAEEVSTLAGFDEPLQKQKVLALHYDGTDKTTGWADYLAVPQKQTSLA